MECPQSAMDHLGTMDVAPAIFIRDILDASKIKKFQILKKRSQANIFFFY